MECQLCVWATLLRITDEYICIFINENSSERSTLKPRGRWKGLPLHRTCIIREVGRVRKSRCHRAGCTWHEFVGRHERVQPTGRADNVDQRVAAVLQYIRCAAADSSGALHRKLAITAKAVVATARCWLAASSQMQSTDNRNARPNAVRSSLQCRSPAMSSAFAIDMTGSCAAAKQW